jgi:hypothetical protein
MDLPNPKDLKALLKVCRDFGVDSVEVGELKIKFGELPREAVIEEVTLGGPTAEEIAFYSTHDPLAAALGAQ